jgi:hypothetical protein
LIALHRAASLDHLLHYCSTRLAKIVGSYPLSTLHRRRLRQDEPRQSDAAAANAAQVILATGVILTIFYTVKVYR